MSTNERKKLLYKIFNKSQCNQENPSFKFLYSNFDTKYIINKNFENEPASEIKGEKIFHFDNKKNCPVYFNYLHDIYKKRKNFFGKENFQGENKNNNPSLSLSKSQKNIYYINPTSELNSYKRNKNRRNLLICNSYDIINNNPLNEKIRTKNVEGTNTFSTEISSDYIEKSNKTKIQSPENDDIEFSNQFFKLKAYHPSNFKNNIGFYDNNYSQLLLMKANNQVKRNNSSTINNILNINKKNNDMEINKDDRLKNKKKHEREHHHHKTNHFNNSRNLYNKNNDYINNPILNSEKKIFGQKNFDKFMKEMKVNLKLRTAVEKNILSNLLIKPILPALEIVSNNDSKEYYIQNCTSVVEFAYKEEQNPRFRDYMEDKGKSVDNYNQDSFSSLFCLFDGHGGSCVSTYLQKNFLNQMKENIDLKNIDKEDFEKLFFLLDNKIKKAPYFRQGSTACIVLITKEENKRFIYCVNIGDTRCILTQSTGARRLSYDDNVEDIKESKRIISHGGEIIEGRVQGELMLTRSFGDWDYKEYGVISTPHVNKVEIKEGDKYLIIATDGVWDALGDLDVYRLSLGVENSKDLCDKIIKNALEDGSKDNISCFAVKLA